MFSETGVRINWDDFEKRLEAEGAAAEAMSGPYQEASDVEAAYTLTAA